MADALKAIFDDQLFMFAVQLSRDAAQREIHKSNLETIAKHDPAEICERVEYENKMEENDEQ